MDGRRAFLLVRLDGVGDAALCVPSLEGLRRSFPDAFFGAACSPKNASLFSGLVEQIIVFQGGEPVSALAARLQSAGYTHAMIATEEVAGYQIARLSGARVRAGFWHRLHKPFKSLWQRFQVTAAVYRPAHAGARPEHEVSALYRLALALGASYPVPSEPAALRRWLNVQAAPSSSSASGAIGIQVTPKLLSGGWGPSSLAACLAVALNAFHEKPAAVIASAADEALACAVFECLRRRITQPQRLHLEVGLPLPQWLSAIESLAVLVTPDTGAAHVAGMLGANVVDVFVPDDYERLSAVWHPWAGSWRSHAKPMLRMEWHADQYGRLLTSQIQSLFDETSAGRQSISPA